MGAQRYKHRPLPGSLRQEIFDLVLAGITFRQVAARLGITVGTVASSCARHGVRAVVSREEHGRRLTQHNRSPEGRAMKSKQMRLYFSDPATRTAHGALISEGMRKRKMTIAGDGNG